MPGRARYSEKIKNAPTPAMDFFFAERSPPEVNWLSTTYFWTGGARGTASPRPAGPAPLERDAERGIRTLRRSCSVKSLFVKQGRRAGAGRLGRVDNLPLRGKSSASARGSLTETLQGHGAIMRAPASRSAFST